METENKFLKSTRSFSVFGVRAMREILHTWAEIKQIARSTLSTLYTPSPPAENEKALKRLIEACILGQGGEVRTRAAAVELGMTFLKLSEEGKARFFTILARDFDINREKLRESASQYLAAADDSELVKKETALFEALSPPRLRLLKQFNALPKGFKFLIDMRADLLSIQKKEPRLEKLDRELKGLLASWFDVGLLDLREITWQSPAALLEKLIEYEAVHEIKSWTDMKNRLDSDRRCFAFFHNKIQSEPLVFVEIALTREVPDSIQKLLDETSPSVPSHEADTAVFYSLSNAQKGLAGIHLGNFLIKQVVEKLSTEMKGLSRFVTLSPVPDFGAWLEKEGMAGLTPQEANLFKALKPEWHADPAQAEKFKPVLLRLCARFLVSVKKGKKAQDQVANFHLNNGASLFRLNWLADTSRKGLKQSYGIMVNYLYEPKEIEQNHETYAAKGEVICSKEVKNILKT